MTEMTRKELIDEMNYSGGIDWLKMYPPEDERWREVWIRKEIGGGKG
jgi:hypothetical protein